MEHKLKDSPDTESAFQICMICGGTEGDDLTTDCVGRPLTEDEAMEIAVCGLDFKNGKWISHSEKSGNLNHPSWKEQA